MTMQDFWMYIVACVAAVFSTLGGYPYGVTWKELAVGCLSIVVAFVFFLMCVYVILRIRTKCYKSRQNE